MTANMTAFQKMDKVLKLAQAKGCSRDCLDEIRAWRAMFKIIDKVQGDIGTALASLEAARLAGRRSVRGVRLPKLLREWSWHHALHDASNAHAA